MFVLCLQLWSWKQKKSYPKKWCAHCSDRRDPEILASWLGDLLCSIPGSYYSLTFTLCFSTMYFNPKLHRFWGWGSSVLPTDHMVTCLNALTKDTMEYDPVIDFLYKRSPFLHSSSTKDSHRALPGPSPPHISRQSFSCDSECSTWAPITSLISQEYYRFSLSLSRSSFPHPNPVIPTHSLHLFQSFGNWLHFCNYVVFAWSLLLVIGSIYKMKKKNEVVDQWRDGWTLHTYYVPGPLPVLGKQQRIQHTLPSWRQSPWRQKWEIGIVGALGRDKGGWKEAKGRSQHLLCWKWNPAYICTHTESISTTGMEGNCFLI